MRSVSWDLVIGIGVALVLLAARVLYVWWLRRRPWAPRPTAKALPGVYVVRWEHIDFCSRTVYAGPDLQRARHLYYHAEGIIKGSTVEFWDGPHRRGVRVA